MVVYLRSQEKELKGILKSTQITQKMTKEAKRKREQIGLTEKSKPVDMNPAILILNINGLNSN